MFKYYSALKATDGFQELIRPMFLHNDNTVAVDVEIKPFPNDLVLKPFASTSTDVLSLLNSAATSFVEAQSATEYDTKSITGNGSGAKITTTVTEVDSAFVISAAVSTTVGDNYVNGDILEFTITQDVGDPVVTYSTTVRLTVTNAVLADGGSIPFKLNVGETAPIPANEFKVLGSTDRSILAFNPLEQI
tara:strand:+ start:77 stop:646 length:570 start_codon:yes stop_codon:yes gene_type:complete